MLLGFAAAGAAELEKAVNKMANKSRSARETVVGVPL
jgi:hypothetical protein